MTAAAKDLAARIFSMTLDINATPEDVWRALTEAGELVRWFPLQARVTPGVGGTMFWGWDGQWAWESKIDGWEPGKRLRLVEDRPAFDASGKPISGDARQLAMEFTLETHAGRTRLRLVHSGFGRGADWDDELESVSAGWQLELRSLRHYLERHRHQDRHHTALHFVTSLTPAEAWQRLIGEGGFRIVDGHLAEGERCTIATPTGDRLSGSVEWYKAGSDLFVAVDDLDAGAFRVSVWRAGGQTGAQVWMTTYTSTHALRVKEFGARVRGPVERLLESGVTA
jgi:uncharacterized protein YndB with AHSA1/START domain